MIVTHEHPVGWVDTDEPGLVQPSQVSGLVHVVTLEAGDLLQGPQGDTGLTGPQGVKGDTGLTGPQGVKGDAGLTGAQGVKGDTGLTGAQGVKGDIGLTGAQGVKGDVGLTGPQGVKGDTGLAGAAGPALLYVQRAEPVGVAGAVWVNTGTENLLKNSSFVGAGWSLGANMEVVGDVPGPVALGGIAKVLKSTAAGDSFVRTAVNLLAGERYVVSFYARLVAGVIQGGFVVGVDADQDWNAATFDRVTVPMALSGLDGQWRRFSLMFGNGLAAAGAAVYFVYDFGSSGSHSQIAVAGAMVECVGLGHGEDAGRPWGFVETAGAVVSNKGGNFVRVWNGERWAGVSL